MMSWRAARRSLARPRAAAPRPRHPPQRLPCRPTTLAAAHPPTVTVYLDMKSPHAYLILAPALQVARDYHVKVEFKPYELSFVDMGISTKHEADGVRHSPSALSDSRAKMFYTVAREYARLQDIQIRGPHKLLQSRLANLALLFARAEGGGNTKKVVAPFLQTVFDAGWPNGWREYDMEDASVLKQTLADLGADVSGFDAFVEPGGEGDQGMAAIREEGDASGCVGVPHLEWTRPSDGRVVGMFGREHLALLRLQLHEQGKARNSGVNPHISHAWRPS